jgi:two-component system chemotaxis response regulator CheB
MGSDGAEGIGEIMAAGGMTMAQDEASSVVFGMPKVAIERGAIRKIVSLSDMGSALAGHFMHKEAVYGTLG